MSAVRLVSRQAVRLGIILLVCAGIAVGSAVFFQTPVGSAALATLTRRGGPGAEALAQGQAPPAGAPQQRADQAQGQAGGQPRVRGVAAQAAEGGALAAGPREGGGRLSPNVRAGLPELLRSAGIMGLFTLVVAVLLRRRKPRPRPAPVHIARARHPDPARAA